MENLRRAADDLQSSDPARAEAAVRVLAEEAGAALAFLRPLFESSDAETRWWAVRTAAELPPDDGADILRRALEDPDLDVRRAATLGMRLRPSPQSIPRLVASLAGPDDILRRLASDALAAIGEPAVPSLAGVLGEPESTAAGYAARALATMRNPAAIPALFCALEHASPLARHWAERGLDALGVGMVFFRP